jgi:PIN like domain
LSSSLIATDRDLGNRFPEVLKENGFQVERHRDHFRPDCPDDEWLAKVAQRGWVAITHDARIRYKRNELEAVVRHEARLLVVVGKASYSELARCSRYS